MSEPALHKHPNLHRTRLDLIFPKTFDFIRLPPVEDSKKPGTPPRGISRGNFGFLNTKLKRMSVGHVMNSKDTLRDFWSVTLLCEVVNALSKYFAFGT